LNESVVAIFDRNSVANFENGCSFDI
jgi:hypothetical protein